LEARVDSEQKNFFQRAAAMREAAVNTMKEHEWILSTKDQQILVEVLINPPDPNAALRAAAEDHFRTIGR
jgi:uncharacterized protein (DUF1778 family)